MQIITKHNGKILDDYGYGKIDIKDIVVLDDATKQRIIERLRFRANDRHDFEYGIGGSVTDEYYKIKSINFSDNDTTVTVRVSLV